MSVRVATFNLLHGVPLRDRVASRADPEDEASAATPADADPHADHAAHGGVAPADRHVWSPEVSDPSALLRSVHELLETGPIDVIALQEVDVDQARSGGVDQAAAVAEAIGATHWRFTPSLRGTPGIASEGAAWVPATEADDVPEQGDAAEAAEPEPRYGIALISRHPVRDWRVTRFPPAPVSMPLLAPAEGRARAVRVPDEPRAALAGIVEMPYADVTVATAHLSFVPGVNTRQILSLRAFVAGMPRPMVLMGDLNTPGGIPGMVSGWDQIARVPTYPVMRPRVQFDHVLADGWTNESIEAAREASRAVKLPISDHCALVTEFPNP